MVEGLKMAAKVALIATVTTAIIGIFTQVRIPGLDFTLFSRAISTALAIAYHWCPGLSIIVPVAISMYGIYLSIMAFHYAAIAFRWVFKVNE